MLAPYNGFVLLLSSSGGPALPVSTLCLRVTHQARIDISLLEVNPTCDNFPYLPDPKDAQRLCDNDMG